VRSCRERPDADTAGVLRDTSSTTRDQGAIHINFDRVPGIHGIHCSLNAHRSALWNDAVEISRGRDVRRRGGSIRLGYAAVAIVKVVVSIVKVDADRVSVR